MLVHAALVMLIPVSLCLFMLSDGFGGDGVVLEAGAGVVALMPVSLSSFFDACVFGLPSFSFLVS